MFYNRTEKFTIQKPITTVDELHFETTEYADDGFVFGCLVRTSLTPYAASNFDFNIYKYILILNPAQSVSIGSRIENRYVVEDVQTFKQQTVLFLNAIGDDANE